MQSISVIITCKDLERFLQEAVDSVKGQLCPVHETIVIHDGCSESVAIAGTTTVFRDITVGVAKSRDEGVRLATGDLLLFLDADDVLTETFLLDSLKVIHRGADVAYPNWLLWRQWSGGGKPNQMLRVPTTLTLTKLLQKNRVVSTSLQRRLVYDRCGPMDPELPMFEDWAYYLKAMREGFVFKRVNTYFKYRQRLGSRNQQDDETKRKVLRTIRAQFQPLP